MSSAAKPLDTSCKNPWQKSTSISQPSCSLLDVMSEQLVEELNSDNPCDTVLPSSEPIIEPQTSSTLEDDEALAKALQHEFDKEHDEWVARHQNQYNGNNKVTVSFENYKVCGRTDDVFSSSDSEDEDYTDGFEIPELKGEPYSFNKHGFYSAKGSIVTKHDPNNCAKENVTKAMKNFGPSIDTGDGHSFDMKLPNRVYNDLKVHAAAETKRMHRLHEKKEHSTQVQAVDPKTRLILFKMVDSGILESVTGSISTGKESVVFHAFGGRIENKGDLSTECAIKIFKTTLNEFKTRERYIRGDFRFMNYELSRQNPRKLIRMFAEKEMMNLNRMRRAGIQCPTVQILRKHVLVMSFIGKNQKPAPKLKESASSISGPDNQIAYDQVIEIMEKMYHKCNLVHADLSEYNLLWHNNNIWVIDVSQSVELCHPMANEFLLRDCTNVSQFFRKQFVTHGFPENEVLAPQELFNKVTQLNLPIKLTSEEFLQQIQEFEKDKVTLAHGSASYEDDTLGYGLEEIVLQSNEPVEGKYAFNRFFDKSNKQSSGENDIVLDEKVNNISNNKTRHLTKRKRPKKNDLSSSTVKTSAAQ